MLFSKVDLRRLIIPLLLEQILVVAIGAADTIMVSFVGEAAVSGVSLVDSINILMINILAALATGGAVVASQYLGRKEKDNAVIASKQLLYTITLVAILIMGLCLIFRDALLHGIFGHVEEAVMNHAKTYFLLSALSYPFLGLYNGCAALLRGMGNSKASLKTSIIMNVINGSGNALFIYGFGWGVFGAALATLISRIAGSIIMTFTLKNPQNLIQVTRLTHVQWRPDMVRRILQIGIPTGMENSFFQLGKLVLQRLISSLGTVAIAANAVAGTITMMQVIPGNALGLAMITVISRCIGAGDYDQTRLYVKKLMKMAYLSMAVTNILSIVLGMPLLSIFNVSQEAQSLAYQIVVIHGVGGMILWPMAFVMPNALRAANDARFTMIVSSISMICFRIFFGYLLANTFKLGVIGVWLAMQIDWLFRSSAFFIRFKGHRWESKHLL